MTQMVEDDGNRYAVPDGHGGQDLFGCGVDLDIPAEGGDTLRQGFHHFDRGRAIFGEGEANAAYAGCVQFFQLSVGDLGIDDGNAAGRWAELMKSVEEAAIIDAVGRGRDD